MGKNKTFKMTLFMLLAAAAWQVRPAISLAGEEGCGPEAVDTDGDGICDELDNCPTVANVDQANADDDEAGDACDACANDPEKTEPGACGCGVADNDSDEDGVLDCADNCPSDSNGDQADADQDGVGDACDECAASVTGGTVIIEKCETGVDNAVTADGCTFMEEIASCAENASTHGKFVSCVAKATKGWTREGLLEGRARSRVIICAAQSDIGRRTSSLRSGR